MSTLREQIEVMMKKERGADIEERSLSGGSWQDMSGSAFDWIDKEYRVKQRPVRLNMVEWEHDRNGSFYYTTDDVLQLAGYSKVRTFDAREIIR